MERHFIYVEESEGRSDTSKLMTMTGDIFFHAEDKYNQFKQIDHISVKDRVRHKMFGRDSYAMQITDHDRYYPKMKFYTDTDKVRYEYYIKTGEDLPYFSYEEYKEWESLYIKYKDSLDTKSLYGRSHEKEIIDKMKKDGHNVPIFISKFIITQ